MVHIDLIMITITANNHYHININFKYKVFYSDKQIHLHSNKLYNDAITLKYKPIYVLKARCQYINITNILYSPCAI